MVVVERTDDGQQVVAVGQSLTQRFQVIAVFVVPFQLQVDTERVVQLGVVQATEHPLGRALQAGLHDGIAQRRHHGHGLLHPAARVLIDDGIILRLTRSEYQTMNHE